MKPTFLNKYKEFFVVAWKQYEDFVRQEFENNGFKVLELHLVTPVRHESDNDNDWFRGKERRALVRYNNDDYLLDFSPSGKSFSVRSKNRRLYRSNDYWNNPEGYKIYVQANKACTSVEHLLRKITGGLI